MIGTRFTRLTVVSDPYKTPAHRSKFVDCLCDCGQVVPVRLDRLKSTTKPTRSCGCLQHEWAKSLRLEFNTGEVFNRLTVIKDLGIVEGRRMVCVKCSCNGELYNVRADALSGNYTSQSCGCYQKEVTSTQNVVHGMHSTPSYWSWHDMKDRCKNPNCKTYEHYGGRGISYDPRWEQFENFYADMGDRPEGMTLDRIDVNGNYCKENCRWEEWCVQLHNRRKMLGTKSQYVGVSRNEVTGNWSAKLNKDYVSYYAGTFSTEEAAAKAYDQLSLLHYGDKKNFKD